MRHHLAIMLLTAALLPAAASRAADDADAGRALYRRLCASCHGIDGRGDGPVASALGERPTDLTTIARDNDGMFPALGIATAIDGTTMPRAHVVSEMPVWGEVLVRSAKPGDDASHARDAILLLTDYVKTLQRP